MSHFGLIRRASRVLAGAAARSELEFCLTWNKLNIRTMASKAVTVENINPNILKLEYAVRGPLVIRATEIEKELEKTRGGSHPVGQMPYHLATLFCPEEIKFRTRLGNSVGSYTQSHGIELIRRHIAEYIERRDGYKANWEDICISSGASNAIKNCLQLFCNDLNGKPSEFFKSDQRFLRLARLNKQTNKLFSSIESRKHCNTRAIVIINPGNPTGQVLTRENIEGIIRFAHKHKLFIFADEVYQDNVYAEGSKFFSFKKVLTEMGAPYVKEVELASFMTVSKGYMGECGLRGGWMELVNMDPGVQANMYKCISAMLCPTTLGQTAVDCVARPPLPGEPSYDLWLKEKTAVLASLKKRAKLIADTFNKMEGFHCNVVQGAMYAFPRFELPPKAIAAAQKEGKTPDTFYAFKLLEETGICVVPGSGFGQRPGTYHFRTTILPQPELLQEMLDIFQKFHAKFTKEFS
ncbi:hypothetical protein K1T71_005857 [Dendrolimus kikuchii]|uniref:Uncharacterized protein n=1 Tax=Dendrolimus kikuchii TaxID=765133 RepID=A0ACC1D233_9NEOP|nr:hypothetical protein K1T71_005857 [Dendrolimus kikuchii]